jgi:hypothetical protein
VELAGWEAAQPYAKRVPRQVKEGKSLGARGIDAEGFFA